MYALQAAVRRFFEHLEGSHPRMRPSNSRRGELGSGGKKAMIPAGGLTRGRETWPLDSSWSELFFNFVAYAPEIF